MKQKRPPTIDKDTWACMDKDERKSVLFNARHDVKVEGVLAELLYERRLTSKKDVYMQALLRAKWLPTGMGKTLKAAFAPPVDCTQLSDGSIWMPDLDPLKLK